MNNETQRTKRIFLEEEYDFDFVLLGIMSTEKFHRLVWLINQKLEVDFAYTDELTLFENKREIGVFSKYYYADELNHLEWTLFANKDQSAYLIPELRTMDYFLLVKGALDFVDIRATVDAIKPISEIQLVSEIDHHKLKSKQNLIF
jgi:hypothetical protein